MKLNTYLSQGRGRAASLAKFIGVTPTTISEWSSGEKQVPMDRCDEIEIATNGLVTREELRPDLLSKWSYLRDSKKAA